ncbi:MAG: CPBP family intramembrane glutamic endopeptidase [Flavobacteriales bacterium]|nr:CPBP family intramembrane glutamic endopeptidase [Flavobacteriales bacterium]
MLLFISSKYDVPFDEIQNWLMNVSEPGTIEVVKWLNNISQIFMFALPPLFLVYLVGKKSVNGFMFNDTGWMVIMVPFIVMSASAPIDLSYQLNHFLIPEGSSLEAIFKPAEDSAELLTTRMLTTESTWQLLTTILAVGIIPAFCEELIFRGAMQPLVAKATKNIHVAIWVTAFFFSLIHFQMYGFLPRMLLGGLLGYLVIWTGSLWTSILAHLFNNCLAILLFHIWGGQLETPEDSTASTVPAYLMSFITCAMLIYVFVRNSRWGWYKNAYLGIDEHQADEVSRTDVPDQFR